MAITTGVNIGKAICEALGLDPLKVGRLEMTIDPPGQSVVLKVTLYLSPEQESTIIRLFEGTKWRELPPEVPV